MIQEKNAIITYQGNQINMFSNEISDSVSLTGIYKAWNKYSKSINAWLKTKQTLEFLDAWERKNNPNYQTTQLSHLIKLARKRNGLSAKQWSEDTNGIGIFTRAGETYAHKDIAIRFAGWLNPNFELYLVEEIQRLKKIEEKQNSLELLTHEQILGVVRLKEIFKYVAHQQIVEDTHKEVFAAKSNAKNPFAEFNKWRNEMLGLDAKLIEERIKQYCNDNKIAITKKILNKTKREKVLLIDSYDSVRNAVWDFLKIKGEVNALNLANLAANMMRIEKGEVIRANETDLFHEKQNLGEYNDFGKSLSETPVVKTARQVLADREASKKLIAPLTPFNKSLKQALDYNPKEDNTDNE